MRRTGLFTTLLRRRAALAALCVSALLLAACGGDDDDAAEPGTEQTGDDASDTTSGDDTAELTDSFRGVTADAIKLGIVMVDYGAIADFVDFARGDQQATAQIFVDWINENGGVGGRRIDPVFVTYPPIPGQEPSPLNVCTQLTDDEQVFAVLGVFIDFTGDGQLCLSRDNETIHIGHELEQVWIDEAQPGLLLTPNTTKEARAENLINLLGEEGTLDGRTVAVLADQNSQTRVDEIVTPGLEGLGVGLGSTAILTITDEDTSAAQAQLDGFIEKWKSEGVDTIFMSGLTASAKQFVQKIYDEIPDVLFIADSVSTLQQAQDLQAAGTSPNPYEGMLSADGESSTDRWANKTPLLQECVDVWEEATGETIVGPAELTPGPDGKTAEIYVAVTDFCDELVMFKTIAEAAGPNLTNDSWVEAVNSFGPIDLVSTGIASLCEGKYAADDEAHLVAYDSSIGEKGDWASMTELADASGGKCAG